MEFLEKLDLPLYKRASADILNLPFQIEIAKTKKPIILSTGGATLKDVEIAVVNISKYKIKIYQSYNVKPHILLTGRI